MKCPYCGAQIANDSLTCPNCGREVQMTFDEPEDDWAQPGGSADQRTGTARAVRVPRGCRCRGFERGKRLARIVRKEAEGAAQGGQEDEEGGESRGQTYEVRL